MKIFKTKAIMFEKPLNNTQAAYILCNVSCKCIFKFICIIIKCIIPIYNIYIVMLIIIYFNSENYYKILENIKMLP